MHCLQCELILPNHRAGLETSSFRHHELPRGGIISLPWVHQVGHETVVVPRREAGPPAADVGSGTSYPSHVLTWEQRP
jgi:hypothetical protein